MAVIATVLIFVSAQRMVFPRRSCIVGVLMIGDSRFAPVRVGNRFRLDSTIERDQKSMDQKKNDEGSEAHGIASIYKGSIIRNQTKL
jgi:hypothetical protein